MVAKRRPRGTGTTRQLTSGRWQARFRGPDGAMRPAPITFDTKVDAGAWLKNQAHAVERGIWVPPQRTTSTGHTALRDYAETWLAQRDIRPKTRAQYRMLLDGWIFPALGDVPLDMVKPPTVRAWHAGLDGGKPVMRAQAYALLRTIYNTAVSDEVVPSNPCRIRGAGSTRTAHEAHPATLPQLEKIVETMPARYWAMVLLAAWCGLRFGELTELRRADVDTGDRVLRVKRGVSRAGGQFIVGDPKTDAGKRTVTIPPHLVPAVDKHLTDHVAADPGALLFPAKGGGHMQPSTLYKVFYPAREAAGRKDLRFHDLRHTGATLAAATGATLADLMARLGHTTPAAAMRYQHAAADRDRAIADALSEFAVAKVVPLRRTKRARKTS